jgi:hypothetical protein
MRLLSDWVCKELRTPLCGTAVADCASAEALSGTRLCSSELFAFGVTLRYGTAAIEFDVNGGLVLENAPEVSDCLTFNEVAVDEGDAELIATGFHFEGGPESSNCPRTESFSEASALADECAGSVVSLFATTGHDDIVRYGVTDRAKNQG